MLCLTALLPASCQKLTTPGAAQATDEGAAQQDVSRLAFLAVYGQLPPLLDLAMDCPPGLREPAGVVELGDGLIALLVTAEVGDSHACAGRPPSIISDARGGV